MISRSMLGLGMTLAVFIDLPCFLIYPLFYACKCYLTAYIDNYLYKNVLSFSSFFVCLYLVKA